MFPQSTLWPGRVKVTGSPGVGVRGFTAGESRRNLASLPGPIERAWLACRLDSALPSPPHVT